MRSGHVRDCHSRGASYKHFIRPGLGESRKNHEETHGCCHDDNHSMCSRVQCVDDDNRDQKESDDDQSHQKATHAFQGKSSINIYVGVSRCTHP